MMKMQNKEFQMFISAAFAGEGFLPYHVDNEPCIFYTAEDIRLYP